MNIHTNGGTLPVIPAISCGTLRVHRQHFWLSLRTEEFYCCPGVRDRRPT